MMRYVYHITVFCFFSPIIWRGEGGGAFSQSKESIFKNFLKISRPEKIWAVTHPLVAKKAWKITVHVNELMKKMNVESPLDGDMAGGQADAFRHAFWMASLCQKIYWRKAYTLGKAHEKGNKIDFKKRRLEEGLPPDKASGEMDLFNNKYGILLWKQYKEIQEDELIEMLKKSVRNGALKVLRKNKNGDSLDEQEKIIPVNEWSGKWENRRTLVSSDYVRH